MASKSCSRSPLRNMRILRRAGDQLSQAFCCRSSERAVCEGVQRVMLRRHGDVRGDWPTAAANSCRQMAAYCASGVGTAQHPFCAHLERDVHGDFSHPERASVDGVRTQTLLLQNDCGVVHDRAVAVLHS
ncbi:hypothetical protein C0Q70_19436 [Pomacea canaliculata]|uniref:Uncharacterized protein n=1 Tax=Pomacea canaliculata TaxID=400727 RepID=A0A2T7NJC1_POMCA|nr:hypothetical protein C0Q70_19436 [Pomacea canaliculata]